MNVSQTPTGTEKAKAVRLAYMTAARSGRVAVHLCRRAGRTAERLRKYSFDDGATWSAPVLLSRDAASAATGGQSITTKDALAFAADNDKPNIFAPPVTSGPRVVVTWASAYCPQNPAATDNAGTYISAVQGAGDLDEDGTPDRPYNCMWTATTTDPALATWDVQQLTNGQRDAIGEVVSGNATGTAYAIAWQEDPAGLQPGEAEGPGDGGMGSTSPAAPTSGTRTRRAPSGATCAPTSRRSATTTATGTGQPGASRPNLQISGSDGGRGLRGDGLPRRQRRQVRRLPRVPVRDATTPTARHHRQRRDEELAPRALRAAGRAAAGSSSLRTVMLWRESPTVTRARRQTSSCGAVWSTRRAPWIDRLPASDILAEARSR